MNRICLAIISLVTLIPGPLFAQQLNPQTDGGTPDPAELAEAAALAAVFGMDLGWQHIEGGATELGTRHGLLSIVRGARCTNTNEPIFASNIRLDAELVGTLGCTPEGDYYIVRFKNAFELGERDVVMLAADAGGSGSPPERLHLIVLDPSGTHSIERDPAFRSVDGTQSVAVAGERLFFDLGYDDGMRKVAVYDGVTLDVEHRLIAETPVPAARCDAAHRTLRHCAQNGRGDDIAGLSLSEFIGAPWSMPNSSRRGLRDLLERPGFGAEAYMQACRLAAETGESPDYSTFAESVCMR